ncbi:MAG TPA: glycoside hydrolase 100 family protein [Chloroflexia bacterium]|nr:glycoside hydrolase 100 family protein [Chloroflexia bacterium]
MSTTALVDEARARAEAVLLANGSELGLLGGGGGAYRQVWARDSMICGLGLLLLEAGRDVHSRSLATLERFQSPLGNIPHNVGFPLLPDAALVAHGGALEPAAGTPGEPVADTIHAGCIDNSLWFILGHYAGWQGTGDLDPARAAWPALERALLWLRYQDSNECGLLEVHEAMDWADLFPNHYNTLYANVLYAAAWRAMAALAAALDMPHATLASTAEETAWKVNQLLWVGPEVPRDWLWIEQHRREWLYPARLADTVLVTRPYYLPYMGFRSYGDRCDTLGNCLAVLLGVASPVQTERILTYLNGAGLNAPYPIRALDHPIQPGDRDWRDYLLLRDLNKPDHYHNGGIWPFIGGFYVAALVAAGRLDEAAAQLGRLAELNRQGKHEPWEFTEWAHGQTGRPMGFARQSWSAALYIYAYEAVRQGRVPLLGGLRLPT